MSYHFGRKTTQVGYWLINHTILVKSGFIMDNAYKNNMYKNNNA